MNFGDLIGELNYFTISLKKNMNKQISDIIYEYYSERSDVVHSWTYTTIDILTYLKYHCKYQKMVGKNFVLVYDKLDPDILMFLERNRIDSYNIDYYMNHIDGVDNKDIIAYISTNNKLFKELRLSNLDVSMEILSSSESKTFEFADAVSNIKKTKLISFYGPKGSGKNTCAEMFDNLVYNSTCNFISFAEVLKGCVNYMFHITEEEALECNKEIPLKHYPFKSPRELYQIFGTDIMRKHFDPDIWIKVTEPLIDYARDYNLFTDMRFPNEYDFLKSKNAQMVRIDRPTVENEFSNHESEKHFAEFVPDYTIENAGDMSDLNDNVCKFMKEMKYA